MTTFLGNGRPASTWLLWLSLVIVSTTYANAKDHIVKWDPVDATDEFQVALDSGADRVIVKNHGTWNVGRIYLKDNQTIVLEKNVHLLVMKRAVTANHHKWFTCHGPDNVRIIGQGTGKERPTLEMRKAEYTDDENQRRMHAFSFYGTKALELRNIILKDLGGDGISLGGDGVTNTCDDVLIENVMVDGARRNGISVVNVRRCTIRDCVFRKSSGVNPQAGIDCETHMGARQCVRETLIENCIFEENTNVGLEIFMLGVAEDLEVPRCEINVVGCTFRNNGHAGLSVAQARDGHWRYGEHVTLRNCVFQNNGKDGWSDTKGSSNVHVMAKSKDLPVVFDACTFENGVGHPIKVWKRAGHIEHTPGGLRFQNGCKIVDNKPRPWLHHHFERDEEPAALTDVHGEVTVQGPMSPPEIHAPYGTERVTVNVLQDRTQPK